MNCLATEALPSIFATSPLMSSSSWVSLATLPSSVSSLVDAKSFWVFITSRSALMRRSSFFMALNFGPSPSRPVAPIPLDSFWASASLISSWRCFSRNCWRN